MHGLHSLGLPIAGYVGSLSKHQRIEDTHFGRGNYTSHGNTAWRLPPPSGSQVLGVQKEGNKGSSVSAWARSTTPRLEEVHCPGQCHSGENQASEENCWSSLHLAPPPPCSAMASKYPWMVALVATEYQYVWQTWKGGGDKD